MIDIRENIVNFLNENISKKGVRQIDLANYLGVSKMVVHHWMKGLNAPTINYIPEIAKFFNVSVLEVLGIEDLEDISIKERDILKAYRDSSIEVKEIIENIKN